MTSFATISKIFARIGNALHKKGDLAGAVEAYDKSLMEHHSDEVYARRKKVIVRRPRVMLCALLGCATSCWVP